MESLIWHYLLLIPQTRSFPSRFPLSSMLKEGHNVTLSERFSLANEFANENIYGIYQRIIGIIQCWAIYRLILGELGNGDFLPNRDYQFVHNTADRVVPDDLGPEEALGFFVEYELHGNTNSTQFFLMGNSPVYHRYSVAAKLPRIRLGIANSGNTFAKKLSTEWENSADKWDRIT